MKSRIWIQWLAVCGLLGGVLSAPAANYYINDNSSTKDVYTSSLGNDAFDGTSTNEPKRTIGNLIGTTTLNPGDVVYIDTGTYAPATISNTVVGASGNMVIFRGSTNGTVFTGAGILLTVESSYINLQDFRAVGGVEGLRASGANNNLFERFTAISNSSYGINFLASSSNTFRHCVIAGGASALRTGDSIGRGNVFERSIMTSTYSGPVLRMYPNVIPNIQSCIISGNSILISSQFYPDLLKDCLLDYTQSIADDVDTLADAERIWPGWSRNAVAAPMFLNAEALDFHLLSGSGFVSNGVWVTNAAVGYSPAIDFGAVSSMAYTNEPEPNGNRLNIGIYGGTAEASKSREDDWLFAMSFNDGGNLIQTGRLEWVAGNLGVGATVSLQLSTNSGSSWSNIATGVAATNETYTWVPAVSHPAVLWRVVSTTNAACASTNAKPFSVRSSTNTVFSFYVNDDSTADDVYCSAVGSAVNLGVEPGTPKRSLQGLLDAYSLKGGDTIYVDTGDYTTNLTTSVGLFDSGSFGNPVRIIGSPAGSLFNRGNTSANVMDLSGASDLQLENLQLTGGYSGLTVSDSDITVRNVKSFGNTYGFSISGSAHVFENCMAVYNTLRALSSTGNDFNQWREGVLWGSPTIIYATSNSLSVSNSILGNGTTLFGNQVVPGDNNVLWDVAVGLTYSTFSDLQEAGRGWERSLFADPLFADAVGGDYHLQSLMGRYIPSSGKYETNDVVHSPAIDLGNPGAPSYTNEPPPNGGRVNAGRFGGTDQASKSRTNAWLQILSFMDGGTLDAQVGAWLRWTGGAFDPGSEVTIWLSRDNGGSWESLATNVTATNGTYFYQNTSTNDPSTLYAMLKVELEDSSPVVESQNPTNFIYKNGTFSFYVNDGSTLGDVYCTKIGSDDNLGVSVSSPMANLANLLTTYQLGAGDRVYVDTGTYPATNTVVLTTQDSATEASPILILGSTNTVGGGSVFGRRSIPLNVGFLFQAGASNIIMRDMILTNMVRGISISDSKNITLERIEVRGGQTRAFDLQANTDNVELRECVANGGDVGVGLQQATNIAIRQCVFWQNQENAVYVGSQVGLLLENSILASTNPGANLFSTASWTGLSSDYNSYYVGLNTRVGLYRAGSLYADDLAAWNVLSGDQDLHSLPGDPQMADPDQYDYHLKTAQTLGRFLPSGQKTSDALSSPLLDAGNPASDPSSEPEPNGDRVNIGRFGGTAEASIALATPWLKAVSFGDAGAVEDGAVQLFWIAGGEFSNETVSVEVSTDGGITWSVSVTSGIPATNGMTSWTVSGLPDTPAAVWRVSCLERTNVVAESSTFFAIRNNPLLLYVNDSDTNETAFTSGPGEANNWMATSSEPLDSLQTIFDRFDLAAGDQIWVDTGTFSESEPILIGLKNSGTSNDPVRITGNNGDTILVKSTRASRSYGIQCAYAGGVEINSLTISNAWTGLYAENTDFVAMNQVHVSYCVSNAVYSGANTWMALRGMILEQSLFSGLLVETGSVVTVRSSLIRDNSLANIVLSGGTVDVKNSIMEASGSQHYIYYWSGNGSSLDSDFNNIRVENNANVAGGDIRAPDRFLIDWQVSSGRSNDMSSFGYAPDFADEDTLDFHLKSEYGRFDPLTGVFITNDTTTSHLIDLGDTSAYSNEPAPNGSRINVGLYGNTEVASKSSGIGALVPLTMSDGGTIRGEATFFWSWNGIPQEEYVNVELSTDGGFTWAYIATQRFANVGSSGLTFSTTNFPSTAMGVWRVSTTNEPPIFGQTDTNVLFAIKNDPLAYYINDSSTTGDVYCTAPGSTSNTGLEPEFPKLSLATLLGQYQIEQGDTVYVDTGIYPRSTPLVIQVSTESPTNYLIIQGSTNYAAGGTVLTNSGTQVMEIQETRNLELRDLQLLGGTSEGLRLTQSSSNRFLRVRSEWARGSGFILDIQSDQNRFIQCAALNFFQTGLCMIKPSNPLIAVATNYWEGGVISPVPATSNGIPLGTGSLIGALSGRIYVSNSVLVANSPKHLIYQVATNIVHGDFNCYYLPYTNSGFAAYVSTSPAWGIASRSSVNLSEWQEWSRADSNSMAADPRFADLAEGDLHPKSAGGRYSVALDDFVLDSVSSPLLDAADPLIPWDEETEPNGSRANIGVYGNTPEASRTITNGTFSLLTLNHGGMVQGDQLLKWLVRGGVTNLGQQVNIRLSTNSGASFQIIGTALASDREYLWNSTTNPSVPTARWRVESQSQSSWAAESERDFLIHNTNLFYYVNDASLSNDVYTTAVGATDNSGLAPDSPLPSLADVMGRYDLEAGDIVYIDTGDYSESESIEIGYADRGTVADPIRIQGSTNYPGTALIGAGISINNASGINLSNFRFTTQPMRDVVSVSWSEDIIISKMDVSGGGTAFSIMTSSNVFLENFSAQHAATNGVASQASYNTRLESGTLWSNGVAQILIRNQLATATHPDREAAFITVSNCIMGAYGTRIPVYEERGTIYANYNNLFLVNGALAALSYETDFGLEYESVGSWFSYSGQDDWSLSHDPKFADILAGDVHLKSSAGRYEPTIGAFVLDVPEDTSPMIDAGDPTVSCVEPDPNGSWINIGRYGNTEEASKTPTNSNIALVSFHDGGRVVGTNVLIHWLARGAVTNNGSTLSIYYSPDGGGTWTNLATDLSPLDYVWSWDSTLSEQSVEAQLKIVATDGSEAQSVGRATVRNKPFSFYINDNSLVNDVYCTAIGDNVNSGLTNSLPMADLNALLERYDLDSSTNGADVVYIDTGVYRGLQPWKISQADTAKSLDIPPVIYQGSTNSVLNGTVLDRSLNAVGIQLDYGVGVKIRNIAISNTIGSAVVFNDCYGAEAEWIAVGSANVAFHLSLGSEVRVANSVVLNSIQGVLVENWTKATNTVFPLIENNVIWETSGSAIGIGPLNSATLRNNILSVQEGQYIYELSSSGELISDNNAIWLESGERVFRRAPNPQISLMPVIYGSVGSWAAASGQDLHTYSGDPLMADLEDLDFHLQSQNGRWDPGSGVWTNDLASSPLIDAGDPASTSWTNESAPNGDRVNIGLYGGSDQASKTSTNSALHLFSLNRGGVVSGQVELSWTPAGLATGHTVRLEISIDDGDSWFLVAEGVEAALGGVSWNSSVLPPSPLARWRVVDEDESGVSATSELPFVLHNGPISYFVNDEFLTGDIYCSAIGSSSNTGVSASAPKRWVSEIIDSFDLEAGDIIYVDTGRYQTPDTTTFGDLDSGDISQDPSQQITVLGSTNELEGGSVYAFSSVDQTGFQLDGTYGIRFKHLNLLGGSNGLAADDSFFIAAEWVNIRACQNGAALQSCSNILFSHSALVGNALAGIRFTDSERGTVNVDSCLIWSNRIGMDLHQGYATISNSIIGALSPDSYAYYIQADAGSTRLQADNNNLYVGSPGAAVAGMQIGVGVSARTQVYYSVSAWAGSSGNDLSSYPQNPELADPDNEDYHLKSQGGRYELGTGWVLDTNSSPLIDAGNMHSTNWLSEPSPNGRRVNIGMYGGSAEASKTPSAGDGNIIYPNTGARVSGWVDMKWAAIGAATNYSLLLEYSPDDGVSWTNIVSGVPAANGTYPWYSVPYGRSALARWRLTCVEDVSITAMSGIWVLDNGGSIGYFVNDDETAGDVYCTAPGNDANSGLSSNAPMANLQTLLDIYSLAPEDVVYVDSGTYINEDPLQIDQTDSGWSNLFVTIQGSTNPAAATIFQASSFSAPSVLSLQYAENLRMKDMTFRNASVGVEAYRTIGCEFENIRIENNRTIGLNLLNSDDFLLSGSILWKNSASTGGVAVALNQSSIEIENSVLWGSPTAVSVLVGSLSVTNSVLDATGSDGRIYWFSPTASALNDFSGDYNSYFRRNGALICEQVTEIGGNVFYNDLPGWSKATLNDFHTMSSDPLFADEIAGDFHSQSSQGRYTTGGWITDAVLSPLVDAGAPAWSYENEPDPNGSRINIGAYGNTVQASMTQTNPPWLRVSSYDGEGILSGEVLLTWLYGGMPPDTQVRLDYSTDYEQSWTTISTNVQASNHEYPWNVAGLPLALALNWRVTSMANTNNFDVALAVPLKTGTYDYYINDGSIIGDIWCSAPGHVYDPVISYGTNAATPLDSLSSLLSHYPVGAGDRVFIDTGTYPVSDVVPVILTGQNTGTESFPLRIYGSTNIAAGGTLLQGDGTANGIEMQNTRNIEVYDLRISSAQNGVALENISSVILGGLDVFNNETNGIWISDGADVECRNLRAWKNAQYGFASASQNGWRNIRESIIWGNRAGACWINSGITSVSNSILCVTNDAAIYTEDGTGIFLGDFNMYGKLSTGVLGTNSQAQVGYENLSQWQQTDRDAASVVADPLFVDPENGEYHLQSRAGNWNHAVWVTNSTDTSWAIDTGNPLSMAWTNETDPTGNRLNMGVYAGTPHSSASDDSVPELFAVTFRDGGIAPSGQPLYWYHRGITSTNTVRIEYSPDNGDTWELVASSLPVGSSPYTWYSALDPSPNAMWQVVLEANTNVAGRIPTNFINRPTPLIYYVNDDSRVGDIYTSAIGASTNRGYSSNSPLSSIQEVLAKYQVAGGDMIKVDTGVYELTNSVTISVLTSGDTTNTVQFTGSTNWAYNGSWFQPATGMQEPAFLLYGAHDVDIANFRVSGFINGLTVMRYSKSCTISDMEVLESIDSGIWIEQSLDIRFNRVLIHKGLSNAVVAVSGEFAMDGCVLWSNRASAIWLGKGVRIGVTNTVLEASGEKNFCYEVPSKGVEISANYNNLYLQNDARIGLVDELQYESLPKWVQGTGEDSYSLSTNALFHDPEGGDFHPRSTAGRFEYGAGWVQDTTVSNMPDFSMMIDMSAPQVAWSNEPVPNGEQRNIGLYGNTLQASKSDSNRWIQAVTAMAGGIMSGRINLTWEFSDTIASNEIVQLEYSYANGRDPWIRIGETAVGQGEFGWQSDEKQAGIEKWPSSPKARWRLFLLNDTNVWSMAGPFGLRNSPFTYYLNDTSTFHDVYTSAIGSDTNDGFYAEAPYLTLIGLLKGADLDPTDRVYIDTGTYWMLDTNAPILWQESDGGEEGALIEVFGSTHEDGSKFITLYPFLADYFFQMTASYVDMQEVLFSGENVIFAGAGLAVHDLTLTNSSLLLLGDDSFYSDNQVDRGGVLLSGKNNSMEKLSLRWGEMEVKGTNISIQNSIIYTENSSETALVVNAVSVIVSNSTVVATEGTALAKGGYGTLKLGHNILIAGGPDSSAIAWNDGGLVSDWNNIRVRDSAWIGVREGKWEKLAYWQTASGQDANSVSFDPLFQNEAQGDFHLNSTVGRWSPIFQTWDVDATQSPLIDMGDPWIGTGEEPMPNGYRRNIGAYGGSAFASKSISNLWLTALTQNDGGVLKGTNIVLRWAAGNAGGITVTLQYYNGSVWTNIATGLSATDGTYIWDSTAFSDSFGAYWRVVAEGGSGVSDQTDSSFSLRNQNQAFYVNDADTTGDIYCSVIGASGNDGLTAATPKLALQEILDLYDLEGGDTVYVDTGSYSSPSDIRIIWSRSGTTNDDIIIQGNTNGAHTIFERSGSTNYPAIGVDVKASQIQLRHFVVRGMDRAILLESNLNTLVQGVVVSDSENGLILDGTQNTEVRNSAFWKTGWGVSLLNTKTTVLENLTFAKSTLAGIRLEGTQVDTMQNNIFIPEGDAYAYSIGISTSLLISASLDYNLYDFSRTVSGWGFFEGATNDLRKYQLTLGREYRSAITNADLVDIDFAGDFHPNSEVGRWTSSGWLQDTSTSWAVDHGNPDMDFSEEPDTNGERPNIGRYGNTIQASQGSTNVSYDVRTLNETNLIIAQSDKVWPLVWSAHLLDEAQRVLVQFSGDNGSTWITLTNTSAYTEYYIWTAGVSYLTAEGRWRVIDEAGGSVTNAATNAHPFQVSAGEFQILRLYTQNGLTRMAWQGGLQGPRYVVEYSDDFGQTWNRWEAKYNGPSMMNKSDFEIPAGESQAEYVFEDRTSYLLRTRWYRMWRITE